MQQQADVVLKHKQGTGHTAHLLGREHLDLHALESNRSNAKCSMLASTVRTGQWYVLRIAHTHAQSKGLAQTALALMLSPRRQATLACVLKSQSDISLPHCSKRCHLF
jgi:hypothetical protein